MASDLDDLINSIRDEAKKESALAVYEGDADDKMVDEEIDERILNLLGLDDAIGIDYATYKTLLREKMAAGRMADSKIPTEETEILTEEFKKIKRKTGRFKVKKKKIKAADITSPSPMKKLGGVTAPKLLPAAKEEKEDDKDYIGDIIKSLDNIIGILKEQNTLIRDTAEAQRKKQEKEKRSKLENNLEKGFKKNVDGAMKIVAPVKSILQKIIDFIMGIILGKFLIKLIDWFAKKENQDKLKALGQFLSDHWPKFAAAFLLFGTGVGGLVRGLIGLLVKGAVGLTKAALGLAARAGIGKAGGAARFLGGGKGKLLTGLITTAAVAGSGVMLSNKIEDTFKPESLPDIKAPSTNYNGGGAVVPLQKFDGGGGVFSKMMGGMMGMVGKFGKSLAGTYGTLGGFVSGEKGVDKVPAMLSDGEFVMSRGAVEKYGVGALESMNAAGGGTNRPQIVQNVIKAHGGGMIGKPRKLKGDSEPAPPETEGGKPSSSVNVNLSGGGGTSGGTNNTNIKIGGGSVRKNMASVNPSFSSKMNIGGSKNTFASFGGNSLNVFSPNINSTMFGGGGNMIMGVNNVLPMMMMVANNMQQESVGKSGSVRPTAQLQPKKAKVSIPGAPSRPPVTIQPPVSMNTGGGGYESDSLMEVEQIPTFSASFSSRDKVRNSKILGIS
jgi:hypothetical protein